MRAADLTGRRFGRLVVLGVSTTYRRARVWACQCDCVKIKDVRHDHLTGGLILSCGCHRRDALAAASFRHGHASGGRLTAEYGIWSRMVRRCTNPDDGSWKDYGGRGIGVSEEWRTSFATFFRDMGSRPSTAHSLERQENDGPYCKENCKWATRIEQGNNKRNNVHVTMRGRKTTRAQWGRELGLRHAIAGPDMRAIATFAEHGFRSGSEIAGAFAAAAMGLP